MLDDPSCPMEQEHEAAPSGLGALVCYSWACSIGDISSWCRTGCPDNRMLERNNSWGIRVPYPNLVKPNLAITMSATSLGDSVVLSTRK